MREFTLAQFTTSLVNALTPISAQIARVLNFKGNKEAWVILQYLLSIPDNELRSLDWDREYIPTLNTRKRKTDDYIDLAFNISTTTPNYPPIFTEWKVAPTRNELSTGIFSDQGKFDTVLKERPATLPKPYPLLVGIAPQTTEFVAPGMDNTDLQNGVGLWLSGKETWASFGLVQYTAYADQPGIPEQPVMTGTLAAAGQRLHP
jgi:hypothetical protein